jgi:SET domain-containing protein
MGTSRRTRGRSTRKSWSPRLPRREVRLLGKAALASDVGTVVIRRSKYRVARANTGLGLFAVAPIARGSHVINFVGPLISTEHADRLRSRNLFAIDAKWTINGSTRTNIARYINHSCKPNCVAYRYDRSIRIFARRNIEPGEELTYDYGKEYFEAFIEPSGCKCRHCAPPSRKRKSASRRRSR